MKKWLLSLFVIPALLFGCNEEAEIDTNGEGSVMPEIVEVVITSPDKFEIGVEIELSAQVKQGDEFINEAAEVKFEVWESGMRDHGIMADGTLTQDGIYAVKHKFEHDGVYYMYAHTTARGMHVMPKKELIVGTPDMSKVLEDKSTNTMNNHSGESDEEDNGEKDSSEHGGH